MSNIKPRIFKIKEQNAHITVCIPAYKETQLRKTLESLAGCDTNLLSVRVRILVNGSETDPEQIIKINKHCFESAQAWIANYSGPIDFACNLNLNLAQKHAGVGLARRILGDEAAHYYQNQGIDGLIVYLDADCTVSHNYFKAIHSFFHHTHFQAAAIRYEHPVSDVLADLPIIEYESHLRYYVLMQNWLALPYAIHTVGSAMAIRSEAYLKKGGMNRRKAGEDFYFLQKFIKDQVCGNIDQTIVFPAARTSDRVPFGTGRAMLNYAETDFHWHTYNPRSFEILRPFMALIPEFYKTDVDFDGLNKDLVNFLEHIAAKENLESIKDNVASFEAFKKRFYQFFDAFQLMKYLHFIRERKGFEDVHIHKAIAWYRNQVYQDRTIMAPLDQLHFLRNEELKINAKRL